MGKKLSNKDVFKGGYFVINKQKQIWAISEIKELFYTSENNQSIKKQIIRLIREASKVIKLCSFIITDDEIVYELEKKCKNSNVAIFILTQLDEKTFSFDFSIDEIGFLQKKEHMSNITKLYDLGVHIRAAKSVHAKFLVCDHEIGILMSANITPQSLNSNPETGIALEESSMELDKLFDLLFLRGSEFVGFTSTKSKQLISSRTTSIDQKELSIVDVSKLKFTWENLNTSLYNSIVELVKNANADIFISTYSVVGLVSLDKLVEEMKIAIGRGLRITLFCRAMNHRQDHLDNCLIRKNIGVEILGDYYNHSKGIFSGKKGIIFTANIDGNHGLVNGFEVGSILNNDQLTDFKNFLQWQIDTAPFSFIVNPLKKVYYEMYDHYSKSKKIYSPTFPSKCTITVGRNVKQKFDQNPIYLLADKEQKIRKMRVSESEFDIEMENDSIRVIRESHKKNYNMNSYLLKYEHLNMVIK